MLTQLRSVTLLGMMSLGELTISSTKLEFSVVDPSFAIP